MKVLTREETCSYLLKDELNAKLVGLVKKSCKEILSVNVNKVQRFEKPGAPVWKITLENNSAVRCDFGSVSQKKIVLQKIAKVNGVNVPEILGYNKIENKIFRILEWIDGKEVTFVLNKKKVFQKIGEELGKLNIVIDPNTKLYLGNKDLGFPNMVWTNKEELYIIDNGKLKATSNIDMAVVQPLLKRIRNKERIETILDSYQKFRDTQNIRKIIEEMEWKWGDRKLVNMNPLE